jgi:hypothetical protein
VIGTDAATDPVTGAFTLSPIQESSTETAGYVTDIIQNVPVIADSSTSVGTITPAASTTDMVSGTPTVSGIPGAANLLADQSLTSTDLTDFFVSSMIHYGN